MGMGDRLDLKRIRNHHPFDMGRQDPGHRLLFPATLITSRQASGWRNDAGKCECEAPYDRLHIAARSHGTSARRLGGHIGGAIGRSAQPQKMRPAARSKMCLPPLGVTAQGHAGYRMQWHKPRLAELASMDRQQALVQIDVVALKPDRLAKCHACHRNQSEQVVVGPSALVLCWRHLRLRNGDCEVPRKTAHVSQP